MMLVQVIGQMIIHLFGLESFAAARFGQFLQAKAASKND